MSISALKISVGEFRQVVAKLGGAAGAAKAVGVSEPAIEAHARHLAAPDACKAALGLYTIMRLLEAAGELAAPPSMAAREAPAWWNVDQLRAIRRYEHSGSGAHDDGFQRGLTENQVAEIEALTREGHPMPAIQVGRLPDGTLVELDGGHRREGVLRAGGPGLSVEVFIIRDLDEARELFLYWNTKRRVVSRKDRLGASRNEPALLLKRIIGEFGLSDEQALGLGDGLLGRRFDLVNSDAAIVDESVSRAHKVCEVWTKSERWGSDRVYSSKRALRVLGVLSREFSIRPAAGRTLEEALTLLRDRSAWWTKAGTCRRLLENTDASPNFVAEQLTLLANRTLNGGSTATRHTGRARGPKAKAKAASRG